MLCRIQRMPRSLHIKGVYLTCVVPLKITQLVDNNPCIIYEHCHSVCISQLCVVMRIIMSYKRQELLTLRHDLGSPPVFGGVRFYFSVLCFLYCLSSFCVFCTQCCQFLWIVHSLLPLRFSLTII